ncbi:hypothetical protein DUNSADRAFT_7201 [Dunaliella salina]|uniref:Secreted protein n=1 Tax=Dunaliella salina TaxID=3046 RepID=A0ABQ7FTH1_DUNSA|nr:hypothetical protein DUNSADRAFT_7201 [Dunaliella salina]|eukprot:KAF5825749.1 hypothetical protein DUNSADRAFT_7201 [Dunaliella salina]
MQCIVSCLALQGLYVLMEAQRNREGMQMGQLLRHDSLCCSLGIEKFHEGVMICAPLGRCRWPTCYFTKKSAICRAGLGGLTMRACCLGHICFFCRAHCRIAGRAQGQSKNKKSDPK